MRKRQMNFIKEMIDILERAHESTNKALSVNSYSSDSLDAITNLLTGCQTTAINIGNLIEESEGEGFITVKYLEDYCELVYSINEELRGIEGSINSEKISKKLNKMLLKIENSIKHDIPLKREAVFLPYKASMWDSLESVWEAADADPDCDAYVIPIPYFDKNPDGSVREEHYEADLFPENVPITHYSEYDFGKHHPDMIFIHNPYDYGNLVTTIHPFFYAENMKKVTECLVYIPYFATSGAMGAEKAWCPVYDYVDYIVIQTEEYRKFYSSDIPDEKFLPFGSPKFDKVIKKCQNPSRISEEWEKSAAGRKVFFYNTSLSCMLQNTPQYLKKMEYVFDTFRKHPEYCLLWRPHPLFESTLQAMRPECLEKYISLKNKFSSENGWILDERPCVEDTISFCYGYVGDAVSSIVALFGVAGKPIFLLDDSINDTDTKRNINRKIMMRSNQSLEGNEKLGLKYILTEDNTIYELGDDGIYKFFCKPSSTSEVMRYISMYIYKEKLVLAPYKAENVILVNCNKKTIETINLKESVYSGLKFQESYLINNRLVLIPRDYCAMPIINLETKEVLYITDIIDFYQLHDEKGCHYGCSWVAKGKLYITDAKANKCVVLDVETLEIKQIDIKINFEIKKAVYMKDTNDCYLLALSEPLIFKINIENNVLEKICININGLKAIDWNTGTEVNKQYFDNAIQVDDFLLLSPYNANKIIRVRNKTNEVDVYKTGIEELDEGNKRLGYFIGGENYFVSYCDNKCYRATNNGFEEVEVNYDVKDVLEDIRSFSGYSSMSQYCNMEKDVNSLADYLENIEVYKYSREEQLRAYSKVNAAVNGDCGEQVYSRIANKQNCCD